MSNKIVIRNKKLQQKRRVSKKVREYVTGSSVFLAVIGIFNAIIEQTYFPEFGNVGKHYLIAGVLISISALLVTGNYVIETKELQKSLVKKQRRESIRTQLSA